MRTYDLHPQDIPYVLNPICVKFPKCWLWNSDKVGQIGNSPLLFFFNEDHWMLPLSMPVSCRQWMMWCSSLCARLSVPSSFFFFFFKFYLTLHSSLVGNSGRLTWVKLQQRQEQRYPFLTVRAVFSCVQAEVWLPMFGIINVHTDVNACDCTRGLYGRQKWVCSESWPLAVISFTSNKNS